MSWTEQRIWLTGASSGIGLALAEQLLERGARLALSARREAPLQALAERYPGQVLVLPGDLGQESQVQAIAQAIDAHWGALDMLLCNAGSCEYVEAGAFQAASIERMLRSNLLSVAYAIEAGLPLLRRGRQAQLVAVGSSVTYLPLPRAEAYGCSKAGLRYLLQSLRIALTSEDIAVTLISPGFVDTPLTQRNDFPMPMRWTAERAASEIITRLPARPLEIRFPGPFISLLRLLGSLPQRWQLAIGCRLARPVHKESRP